MNKKIIGDSLKESLQIVFNITVSLSAFICFGIILKGTGWNACNLLLLSDANTIYVIKDSTKFCAYLTGNCAKIIWSMLMN